MMSPRIGLPIAALVMLLTAPMVRALCAGDCGGDGQVTVNELLILVNLALDNRPVADCSSADTNTDGMITVAEIVAAVHNALAGCLPNATGTWQQDQATIISSTCAAPVTAIIQQNIDAGDYDCVYQLEQSGAAVTITAMCGGETFVVEGTVNADGELTVTSSEQETMDGCSITLTETTSGIITMSPTTGTHTIEFGFAPACVLSNCTIIVRAQWVKLS